MEDENDAASAVHGGENIAPALILVHPHCTAVVVAIGATFRIFDFDKNCSIIPKDETTPSHHDQAIRTVTFNRDGKLFASAGDDKLVKIWDAKSWTCIKTVCHSKKLTSVAFSQDSEFLLFADKFGAVFLLPVSKQELKGPVQMLAHCCSIITDMVQTLFIATCVAPGQKVTPDGKHIITSDRDFKIRVSVFPARPTAGAHEIWSYCLGHTSFVTCLEFVSGADSQRLLVSGGGDSTVRLWDYKTGELLDTFVTVNVAKFNQDEDGTENSRAVVGVSVSPAGSVIAVIIERFAGVILLECDSQLKRLQYLQVLALPEQVCTTGVTFDARGQLWLAAGAASEPEFSEEHVAPEAGADAETKSLVIGRSAVVQVRLIAPSYGEEAKPTDSRYVVCNPNRMPWGHALLQALQSGSRSCRKSDDATSTQEVAMAAEAAELAMKKLMTKRQYTVEQRENRKRLRNDKKLETKGAL